MKHNLVVEFYPGDTYILYKYAYAYVKALSQVLYKEYGT